MPLYDTTFKELITRNFLRLLPWLLPGLEAPEVLPLSTELPATLRRVDLMFRARLPAGGHVVVIFECQCQHDPELQKAMLLRTALAHYQYDLPVMTVLLAFTEAAAVPAEYVYGQSDLGPLAHRVLVRRVFDESAEAALALGDDALLPLVPAMRPEDGDRERLLLETLCRIAELPVPPEYQRLLLDWAVTFATLHLPTLKVERILQEARRRRGHMLDPLRDFPWLKRGYDQGVDKGRKEGLEEGMEKGLEQGMDMGKGKAILLVLSARGILVSDAERQQIEGCADGGLLDRWLSRVATAASVADVLSDS